jgi:hypothetical protein
MVTFLKDIDEALRSVVYTKFLDNMGFSSNESDDVIFYPKEIAQRIISEKRGVATLEFANIWRIGTNVDWTRQRTPLARRGLYGAYVDGEAPSSEVSGEKIALFTAKTVPATLDYNIWFWSQDRDKLNAVTETYLFWQHVNPNLDIYYNDVYPLEFDLHFGEIIDESDLPSMFEIGRYFVIRVPIRVEGWVFSATSTKTIKKIIVTLYDEDDIESTTEFLQDATEEEQELLRLYRKIIYADE